uniref:Ankyrin giant isoform n=1 Tax=Phallusia mammillata TaxID=59560 RepID=A0A6F9D770_9ASCI|nr:ankyrin giant isoform [Phallusia mammillata]
MASSNAHQYPLAQQLLRASAKGDLQKVVALIQNGATLAVNKHGRTPLHIASHRGFLDIVRVLLQYGCDPDLQDDNGDTPLHRAVNGGHVNVVQRLLDEACSVDRQNNLGDIAIHEAARCGHTHIVKLLLKANTNVDCANKNGDCPLHMSCGNGHTAATRHIVAACSNTSPSNKQQDTPLHLVARFGHIQSAKILLAANCNLNAQNQLGNTAMHVAVVAQNQKIVRLLLDAHSDVKKLKNKKAKTALDLAKDLNAGELALMLISGARPSSGRQRGRKKHKDPLNKGRSRSEPKETVSDGGKQVNDQHQKHKTSFKRFLTRRKKSRSKSQSPERTRISKEVHTDHKPRNKPRQTLDDCYRNLTVNPYVVPQLFSLYRDKHGDIQQMPVLDQLPNPTPQIVEEIHEKIWQSRRELHDSVEQTNTSLMQKIQDLQQQTEFQLKSLDRLTTERINAERIMCLHRIDQRAVHERYMSEHNVLNKLQGWMETRLEQRTPDCEANRSYLLDVKPCEFAPIRGTSTDEGSLHNDDLQPSAHVKRLIMGQNREVESRSLDSGVGGTSYNREQSLYPSPPASGSACALRCSPREDIENMQRKHVCGQLHRQRRVLSYTPPVHSDSSRSTTPLGHSFRQSSPMARISPCPRANPGSQSWHGQINRSNLRLVDEAAYCTDEEAYLLNMLKQEKKEFHYQEYNLKTEDKLQIPVFVKHGQSPADAISYEIQHEDIAIIDQLRDFTLSQTHAV